MKKLLGRIKEEWEKMFFWLVLASTVALLLARVAGLGESENSPLPTGSAPPQLPLLTNTALAFLSPPPEIPPELGNPFMFITKKFQPEKKRPWTKEKDRFANFKFKKLDQQPRPPDPKKVRSVRPPRKTDPAPPRKTKPEKTKPSKPTVTRPDKPTRPTRPKPEKEKTKKPSNPKPEKSKPETPPEIRIVTFQGSMTTTSGERVALIQTVDPRSKKTSLAFLKPGSTREGITIKDFDQNSLTVQDPQGKEREIDFGQRKKMTLE